MKPITRQLLTVIFFLSFSITTFSANTTIKVALGEWPPYTSESLPHNGLLAHILSKALASEGVQAEFHFMDWESAFSKTLQGKFSLSPGWLKSPQRAQKMHFSEPMSYVDLRFIHRAGMNFTWEKLEDIKGLKIGIVLGYSYGKELDQFIVNGHVRTTDYLSEKEALIGLANNEIDLYAADAIVAESIINQIPVTLQKRLAIDEKSLSQSPIYLLSPKRGDNRLIQKFNAGLARMKAQGDYTKILENFNLVNKVHQLNFYTEDNAPLNYQGSTGADGIMVGIVESLLTHIGADIRKVDIEILPWARAFLLLEQKKKSVLFAMTKTAQRSQRFKWVGPVYRSNIVLLGRKTTFSATQALSELGKYSVCSVKEDVSEKLWKDNLPDAEKLFLVSHPKQCAKMLALQRVDLWASGQDTARWQLQKIGADPDDYIKVNQLKESFRYIAFSQDVDDDIINSFQKTLNYLKLSGKLDAIIQQELEEAEGFAAKK